MNAISPLSRTTMIPSKKPRMLVVDDEPDNLDLLYRTFRREYNVLRAESGLQALEVLQSEGEVAVIISDQRMPEMSGTEFLSKTVPEFPDTVRIILTGFTDVEDLVDAINAGQVYRYITKPWDPEELKAVVERAASTYELLKQRNEELYLAEKQTKLLGATAQLATQPMSQADALTLLANSIGQILETQICVVQRIKEGSLTDFGLHGALPNAAELITQNPVIESAIATRTVQSIPNIATDETLATAELYQVSQTQSHLVAPILFQGNVMGLLSLQWASAYKHLDDVNQIMNLLTAQIALAMTALGD
jgi:CheY-like chemotaxis protein